MARTALTAGKKQPYRCQSGPLADLVRNVFIVIVMFIAGLIVGYRPSVSVVALLGAVALMLLASFAFSWIAATIGLAVDSVEAA